MPTTPTLALHTGAPMPAIGFGTWGIKAHDIDASLRAAVTAGYRLFDLAPVYNNEHAVGRTLSALISEGAITRGAVFLTSKVPPADACDRERLLSKLRQTLADLQTSYLDLYLVHWPFCVRNDSPTLPPPMEYRLGYSAAQLRAAWAVLEETVSLGLVRHIGLSNIGVRRLQALVQHPALRVRPSVVQVEHHPYNANRALRAYCDGASPPIRLTAYSSLGSGARPAKYQAGQPALLEDGAIVRVAAGLSATPAALALAWALRGGVAIVPKSTHAPRIAANLGGVLALAPRLNASHMQALDALDRGFHYLAEGWRAHAWRPGMSLDELYDDPPPRASAAGTAAVVLPLVLCVAYCALCRQCAPLEAALVRPRGRRRQLAGL